MFGSQSTLPIDNILFHSEVIRRLWSAPEFSCFEAQILRGWMSKFMTQFLKLRSIPSMWESLVVIGRGTSEIMRWKKKEKEEYRTDYLPECL